MSTVPIPIRLQLSTVSATAPIDANTGNPPAAWRGQALAVQVGIFDGSGVAVDLSSLASLTVAIQTDVNALTPLATVTTTAIGNALTMADWLAGLAQQAECDFTAAQMDQSLGGAAYASLWVVVTGITTSGAQIIYGAGAFTLALASNSVPFPPPAGLVSYHSQTNTTGNSTVSPTSQLHTEKLTTAGAARTSAVIMATAGISAGARVTLALAGLNVISGIVLNFYSGSTSGPLLFSYTTTGITSAGVAEFFFDGTQWQFLFDKIPSL
jgi:hypothetical protein